MVATGTPEKAELANGDRTVPDWYSGPRLLTLSETAAILRRTESQLRWLIYRGGADVPPSAIIGGRRMFRESDVRAFLETAFLSNAG